MIEPLLLTTTRLSTCDGERRPTGAGGIFFECDGPVPGAADHPSTEVVQR